MNFFFLLKLPVKHADMLIVGEINTNSKKECISEFSFIEGVVDLFKVVINHLISDKVLFEINFSDERLDFHFLRSSTLKTNDFEEFEILSTLHYHVYNMQFKV